ncbi:MAG: hypothetical protein WAM91_00340 [Candidatus Acidiferrales bacterium]
MRRLRFPGIAIAALLGASAVAGQSALSQIEPSAVLKNMQQQSAQLAASWLHASDPRLQAWGAYFVLRDRLKDLSPDLIALLSAHQVVEKDYNSPDNDQHDAIVAVLDALIQLDLKVPVSEAARLYPEFPAETLLLLSKFNSADDSTEPEVTEALLHIFESEPSSSNGWLAAGDLLASRRAPGFAALVLKGMVIHLDVGVWTPNQIGGFGSGSSCCGGIFSHEPKKGWPEVGNYELFDCGTPGRESATMLAGGKDPAYYVRTVDALYGYGSAGSCGCRADRKLIRQHFLETLLGDDDENIPVKATVSRGIEWHDGATFVSEILGFIQTQRDAIAQVVKELEDNLLLTSDEAAVAMPRIEIQINDYRDGDKTPLPPLPNLGANISVTKS